MTTEKPTPEDHIRGAFDLARRVAEHPEEYPKNFVVVPLDADIMGEVLSGERLRMLRAVREDGPFESVNHLAAHLERDQSRVSRDLARLADAGLVVLQRVGKAKRVAASDREILLA